MTWFHKHGWYGEIIRIDPNAAEDGALWAMVRVSGGVRYCPVAELMTADEYQAHVTKSYQEASEWRANHPFIGGLV